MRWRRDSDGWASVKGGSGEASSMRRCLRRRGEGRGGGEQRARCGEAETGAPFIGVRRGDGRPDGGGALSRGGRL
jgi:hypothetical protein